MVRMTPSAPSSFLGLGIGKMTVGTQLRLLLKRSEFFLIFCLMMFLSMGQFLFNCVGQYGQTTLDVLSSDQLFICRDSTGVLGYILPYILPIVITIPFVDTYLSDRLNGTLPVYLTRTKTKTYYFSKLFVVAISAMIVVFVPFILNYLLGLIAFPSDSINYFGNLSTDQSQYYAEYLNCVLFPALFIRNPNLYNLLFLVLLTVFLGIAAVLVYQISFYIKKSRILLLCTFFILNDVLVLLSNLFMNDKGVSFAPMDYFFPASVTNGKHAWMLLVFFSVLLGAVCLLIPGNLKKLNELLE